MATTLRTPFTLNTSPVNDPASQQSDIYLYNNHYLPYFSVQYYIIMAIYIMYIPFIIVSSSLVITAVILMKKHQNQHNIFLLAVSIYDLLVAVIAIPARVLLKYAVTKETLDSQEYRGLCIIIGASADMLEFCTLNSLTLLGLDLVIQVRFPLRYRRLASIKKACACLGTMAIVNLCSIVVLTYLRFLTKSHCEFVNNIWSDQLYFKYFAICTGTLLLLCFFSGVYVRYKRNRLAKNNTGKTTTWLLMMFILFYMPTLFVLMKVVNFDLEAREFAMHLARLVRYLSSVTNGPLIFHFRPTYNFAFKYFISTNPFSWNQLEKRYENNKTASTTTALSSKLASLKTVTPPFSRPLPEKCFDLSDLTEEDKNCERENSKTSNDCSRKGSRIWASNSRRIPQSDQ